MFAFVCFGVGATHAGAQLSTLHASGRNIVNASGTVVPLRGVNLGGLFVMEQWMAPLDSDFVGNGTPNSGNDTYGVMNWLANTYGVATEQSLISTYQNAWIQASDLDNIKNAGFNVIRVPVWWGQFFQLPLSSVSTSGWRSDAFTYLDWLVSAAGSRGIYVIIDMHGAVGSQSVSDSTGQQNTNLYWSNGNYQSLTNYMWQQIASHYNGNSTVAGYDLLNEPDNPPSDSAVISAYSSIYSAIRGVDPNHMIFIEGCFDQWNWSMLPNPSSMGWSNVVYEMHAYPPSGGSAAADDAQADAQVSDFNNHSNYNVPGYIGEFSAWNFGAAPWQYTVSDYNNAGMSWTMWTYKSRTTNDGWGYYTLTGNPPIPHIYHDSTSTIANDWSQWTTSANFSLNGNLGGINGGGVNTGGGSTSSGSSVNLSFPAATSTASVSMGSSPSFANFNGTLYAAYRSNDTRNILFISTSTDGVHFSGGTSYSNIQMGSAPSLAVFNNKLYVAFQANDSSHKLFVSSSSDGVTFAAATGYPNIQIGGAPSLAALNGVLYAAFQANDPSNAIWIAQSSDGVNFSSAITNDSTNTAPALTAFNNNLYLAFRSNDTRNILFVGSSSNGSFSGSTAYTNIAMGSSPALGVANGALYITFQANDPSHLLFVTASTTGTNFPAATGFSNISIGGAPTAAAFGSNLSIGFQSNDSRNLLFATEN